jgi:hypothetical protein
MFQKSYFNIQLFIKRKLILLLFLLLLLSLIIIAIIAIRQHILTF